MRRRYSTLLLANAMALAMPVLAHDINACLPIDDADTLVCLHYFEGTTIDLPVRETLDNVDEECEHLVVTVLQRQGLLLAQLGEPQEFGAEQCATMTSIELELPNVRSEVDVLVQLSLQGDDKVAGAIALRVYPDNLLEPLTRYAEHYALVVFDGDGVLTRFLEHNNIDYAPGFRAVSGVPLALLVQPAESERLLNDRGFDTAVIFKEKIVDLPQIRTFSSDGQTRVYVEMPFLHDLHNSPLAQKALLDIIRLATNPIPIDRG